MKTCMAVICILCLIAMATGVLADAADRFKGASYDGYDRAGFYQTTAYDPALVNARFKGASYDGYDRSGYYQDFTPPNLELINARFRGAGYDGYDMGVMYLIRGSVFKIR